MDKFYLLDTDLVLKIYRELMEKYNSNAEIRDIKLLESAISVSYTHLRAHET
ncbi:MAG: hypothetical protein CI947_1818, partial [Halanaerobium sp.]